MSGIKNTVQKFKNASLGRGFHTSKEVRTYKARHKAADVKAGKDKMFQNAVLPDEEEIRLVERRKAAKRKGSRAQTVMTDRDTLG